MRKRHPPDDPREWINRSHSDLEIARSRKEGVYLEDLCFHARQAAEKAIKALLIKHGVEFPYVHDIAQLLTLLAKTGLPVPERIREAARLTRFAVITRYPGLTPPVDDEEYEEALALAQDLIHWVESRIRG